MRDAYADARRHDRGPGIRRGVAFALTLALASSILTAVIAPAASAATACASSPTKTWDRGAGTDSWSDAANWAPNGVPGAAAIVCITAGAPGTQILGATGTILAVDSAKPLTVNGLAITSTSIESALTNLTLHGDLGGAAQVKVSGIFTNTQTCSTISDGLTLNLLPPSTGSIGGTSCLQLWGPGTTLRNQGDLTVDSFSGLGALSGGTLKNEGTLRLGDSSSISAHDDGSVFWNTGTITTKTGFTTGSIWGLDNDGLLTVGSGELSVSGHGIDEGAPSWAGNEHVAPGAILEVSEATIASGTATGAGTVRVESDVKVTGISWSLTNLALSTASFARLSGPGQVNVSGTFTGTGCQMEIADGLTLNLLPSSTGLIAGSSSCFVVHGTGTVLRNQGDLTVEDDWFFHVIFGGTLKNEGTLRLGDSSSVVANDDGSALWNTGTITTKPGFTTGSIWGLDNDGLLTVGSGELHAYGHGTGEDGPSWAGNEQVASGATLRVIDAKISSGSATGAGTVRVAGHVKVTGAAWSLTNLALADGSFARLSGPGRVNVSGTFDNAGCQPQIDDGLTLNLLPSSTGSVSGESCLAVSGGGTTFRNQGDLTVETDWYIQVDSGGTLNNEGTMRLGGDSSSVFALDGSLFRNAGTITTTAGFTHGSVSGLDNDGLLTVGSGELDVWLDEGYDSGTETLRGGTLRAVDGATLDLTNVNGTVTKLGARVVRHGPSSQVRDLSELNVLRAVDAIKPNGGIVLRNGATQSLPGSLQTAGEVTIGQDSSLTTTGAYTQTGGETRFEPPASGHAKGTLTATGSTVNVQGGTLTGVGTVLPALANSGTVAPGLSLGTLDVIGSATLASDGNLDVEIGATQDRLAVSGTATLGGTLRVSTKPGFVPTVGQTFDVVTAGTRSGTFDAVTGVGAGAGIQYAVSYPGTDRARLTVVSVPGTDLVISATPVSPPLVSGVNGHVSVEVANAGGAAGSGTTTVTLTPGANLSAVGATGAGWSCSGTAPVTCTRSGGLASGASFPTIDLTVTPSGGAGTRTLTAAVSGGGDTIAGNNSVSASIPVVVVPTPNAVILPSVDQTITAGHQVTFDATASTGVDAQTTYRWDFGDGKTNANVVRSHTFQTPGRYVVSLKVTNGPLSSTATRVITVLENVPVRAQVGDDRVAASGTTVSFSSAGSQPEGGLTYDWDFGDGSAHSSDANPTHTFTNGTSSPIERTVSLTVTRAMVSDTDHATVTVLPASGTGLTVSLQGAGPVSGGTVVAIDPQGTLYTGVPGEGAGEYVIRGLVDGPLTVYGAAEGYLPASGQTTIADGNGALTLSLDSGEVGVASLESERLTYEEILDAGIDPNDPDNQVVFEFTICLAFNGAICTVEISALANEAGQLFDGVVSGGGGGGCSSSSCGFVADGQEIIATVTFVDRKPVLSFLMLPGEARWLKEFFQVQMVVVNMAPPAFTFTDGAATLDLPNGLALAPTATPQTLTQTLDDIPGGTKGTATWIVRGDKEGQYDLHASYSAGLDPVGHSVFLEAATKDPLRVWGRDAIKMTVDADDAAVEGEPYRFRVGLENVTTGSDATDVYNAAVEMLDQEGGNFIYQPRTDYVQAAASIAPGDTFWTGYYVVIPEGSGQLNVAGSAVLQASAPDQPPVQTQVVSHARTPAQSASATGVAGGVSLSWSPVAGATGYQIFRTNSPTATFKGATPLAGVGAGATSATVASPVGQLRYFVISPTVGGKGAMAHAMLSATALPDTGATPKITKVAPAKGKVGANVTITGTKLAGATAVTFNGTAAVILTNNATKITTKVPAGATNGKISVTTLGGTAMSPKNFTVQPAPKPTIKKLAPMSGPVGATVTITGKNMAGATAVKFNGTTAAILSNSATKIKATVPAGATTGKVSVTTSGGTAQSAKVFTVGGAPAGAPTIKKLKPAKGPVGKTVTITGTKLGGATAVTFNGVVAVILTNTAKKITAKVPAGATTGKVAVTTANGTGQSPGNFKVT